MNKMKKFDREKAIELLEQLKYFFLKAKAHDAAGWCKDMQCKIAYSKRITSEAEEED